MEVKLAKVDVYELRNRLEQLKRERIEEARRLGITTKAVTVAKVLGKSFPKKHGSYVVYPKIDDREFKEARKFRELANVYDLLIVWDDYGGSVSIWYYGKLVYHYDGSLICVYRRGEWLRLLDEKYEEAREIEERQHVLEVLEEIKKETDQYGSDLRELGLEP